MSVERKNEYDKANRKSVSGKQTCFIVHCCRGLFCGGSPWHRLCDHCEGDDTAGADQLRTNRGDGQSGREDRDDAGIRASQVSRSLYRRGFERGLSHRKGFPGRGESGLVLGDFIIGGVLGLCIDYVDGAAYVLKPTEVNVTLNALPAGVTAQTVPEAGFNVIYDITQPLTDSGNARICVICRAGGLSRVSDGERRYRGDAIQYVHVLGTKAGATDNLHHGRRPQ